MYGPRGDLSPERPRLADGTTSHGVIVKECPYSGTIMISVPEDSASRIVDQIHAAMVRAVPMLELARLEAHDVGRGRFFEELTRMRDA